jgi:hypothetical protein
VSGSGNIDLHLLGSNLMGVRIVSDVLAHLGYPKLEGSRREGVKERFLRSIYRGTNVLWKMFSGNQGRIVGGQLSPKLGSQRSDSSIFEHETRADFPKGEKFLEVGGTRDFLRKGLKESTGATLGSGALDRRSSRGVDLGERIEDSRRFPFLSHERFNEEASTIQVGIGGGRSGKLFRVLGQ